jgi:hypothetical protein
VNPIDAGPVAADGLDPATLQATLNAVHAQLSTALWLSAGMLCALAAITCGALGWRRAALLCGLLYFGSLCLVRSGRARVVGPAGGAIAIAGLLRPRRRASP